MPVPRQTVLHRENKYSTAPTGLTHTAKASSITNSGALRKALMFDTHSRWLCIPIT